MFSMSIIREFYEDFTLERKELGPIVTTDGEEEYRYEEVPFDDWISDHDEAAITLYHEVTDRAASYGLPLIDCCDVTDFLYFVYTHSTSKFKKVRIEYGATGSC